MEWQLGQLTGLGLVHRGVGVSLCRGIVVVLAAVVCAFLALVPGGFWALGALGRVGGVVVAVVAAEAEARLCARPAGLRRGGRAVLGLGKLGMLAMLGMLAVLAVLAVLTLRHRLHRVWACWGGGSGRAELLRAGGARAVDELRRGPGG